MNIIVGSARIDENGKITGGKAGDQTGKEISTQKFYVHSKGWYVIRAKNKQTAKKIAEAMLIACNNDNIGYDQGGRLGIIKYGVNSKVKTEADCSSTVRACIMYATGKDVGNFTTANEVKVLEKSGMFDKAFAYTNSTVLKTGDILCTKTQGHTVVVVSGNPVDNRPVIKIGDKVTLTVNLKCYKESNNKSDVWHINELTGYKSNEEAIRRTKSFPDCFSTYIII